MENRDLTTPSHKHSRGHLHNRLDFRMSQLIEPNSTIFTIFGSMPLTLQRIEILKLPSIENADKIVKSDDVLLSSDADSLKSNAFQHLYSRGAKRFGISFQNILRVPNCTVLLVHLYAYALLYFPCCCCVSKQKCCFVGVAQFDE